MPIDPIQEQIERTLKPQVPIAETYYSGMGIEGTRPTPAAYDVEYNQAVRNRMLDIAQANQRAELEQQRIEQGTTAQEFERERFEFGKQFREAEEARAASGERRAQERFGPEQQIRETEADIVGRTQEDVIRQTALETEAREQELKKGATEQELLDLENWEKQQTSKDRMRMSKLVVDKVEQELALAEKMDPIQLEQARTLLASAVLALQVDDKTKLQEAMLRIKALGLGIGAQEIANFLAIATKGTEIETKEAYLKQIRAETAKTEALTEQLKTELGIVADQFSDTAINNTTINNSVSRILTDPVVMKRLEGLEGLHIDNEWEFNKLSNSIDLISRKLSDDLTPAETIAAIGRIPQLSTIIAESDPSTLGLRGQWSDDYTEGLSEFVKLTAIKTAYRNKLSASDAKDLNRLLKTIRKTSADIARIGTKGPGILTRAFEAMDAPEPGDPGYQKRFTPWKAQVPALIERIMKSVPSADVDEILNKNIKKDKTK